MVLKNYYKILDLETSHVSIDEIRQAYRQAAKKYHPDLNVGDNLAEERIKDINEAYKVLSVPSSKRKYDRIWNSKFGKGPKAFEKSQKGAIFNIFLGNLEENKKEDKPKKNPIKGENIETEINISIEDGFYGTDKKIALKNLEGKDKFITVKVPEGIQNGEKIRLVGQGKQGKNGGKNGDLYIKINIQDSKKYKLEGKDLYTEILISPWEAALGTKAKVNSIDDTKTQIFIPSGIQSGEVIEIPQKGYKTTNGERGNLIAKVRIVVPNKLTKEETEMFKKLKEISKFNPRRI